MTAAKHTVLGITGTISSGKSLVGKILARQGIAVIDTDQVVHELLSSDEATKKSILNQFGAAVFAASPCQGEPLPPVDRKALGALVFSDPQKRRNLEAILHPNVILNCRKRVKDLSESGTSSRFPLVAILVPLLFEAKLEKEYDEIWSVFTEESVLRQRLGERDKLSQAEIENRLAAQLPQSEKARRAGQVIDNSGTPDETERQVNLLLEKMFPAGKPQTLS